MDVIRCNVCNKSVETEWIEVHEMMFGYGDKFHYFQCPVCECLQIANIPTDIQKYYPSDYLSFNTPLPQLYKKSVKGLIRRLRNNYAYYNKGILGRFFYKYYPIDVLRIISKVDLTKDSSILDVGSGTGALLYDLKELGFDKLLGIDPFIKEDIVYENGLTVQKKSIHEVDGKWDLIMLHHSFEHMSDPYETLVSIRELLKEEGVCIIRIPTVSSYAWEHYKENWVQLDAPRHYFLHSVKSMNVLAQRAQLAIENIIYDSTDFQFWGSEQYLKNIVLTDPRSHFVNPKKSLFSHKDISLFKQKAEDLNKEGKGDTFAVFLKKV